jgi:peroxiredoxin (alkyl hydroperoxide reductase subunit C)
MRRIRVMGGVVGIAVLLTASWAMADVLGPCGTPDAQKPAAAVKMAAPGAGDPSLQVSRLPLPGEQAPNFRLDAVVGNKVKKIKLSDYDGKWRVVCFYPADFTFV